MFAVDKTIRELTGLEPGALPDEVLNGSEPVLLRGVAAHWPIVQAARESGQGGGG